MIQITFDTFCAVKSQTDLKLKARSEYSNVWGEYKNHSNLCIQGTIVACDNTGCRTTKVQQAHSRLAQLYTPAHISHISFQYISLQLIIKCSVVIAMGKGCKRREKGLAAQFFFITAIIL